MQKSTINKGKLETALRQYFGTSIAIKNLSPIVKGYSNLTYKITLSDGRDWVLRHPPLGNKIQSAHDMKREFTIQSKLWNTHFRTIPEPLFYSDDETILGAEFYVMGYVEGLTPRPGECDIKPMALQKLSKALVKTLAALHQTDLKTSGLQDFYRGEGYIIRQIKGWTRRYANAKTPDAKPIEALTEWLLAHIPQKEYTGLIHNDFKYDNVIVDVHQQYKIKAIVDWEMATVGDVLSDLGTTLSYWSESGDPGYLSKFTVAATPGNLTREEVVRYYEAAAQISNSHWLFYYVLGCLKLAGIVQQIYFRYKTGKASDGRFKNMITIGTNCLENAQRAIRLNRISHLYS